MCWDLFDLRSDLAFAAALAPIVRLGPRLDRLR